MADIDKTAPEVHRERTWWRHSTQIYLIKY